MPQALPLDTTRSSWYGISKTHPYSSLPYSPALNFDEDTCNCCHFGKGVCLLSGLYGNQDRVGSQIVFGLVGFFT